jgi:hypothetical protein
MCLTYANVTNPSLGASFLLGATYLSPTNTIRSLEVTEQLSHQCQLVLLRGYIYTTATNTIRAQEM